MQIKQLLTKIVATALGAVGVDAAPQAQNVVANDDTIVTNVTRGSIPITTLLNNDTEINGAPLFILNVGTPQFGTAVLSRDSNNVTFVSYTPNRSFSGIDSFTYRISDRQNGLGSSSTATITLLNPFLSGRGIYASSLSGPGGSHDVSGFFNISVTPSGTFSSAIRLAGTTTRMSGNFDLNGNFLGHITRIGLPDIEVALSYDISGKTQEISGVLTIAAEEIKFTAPKVRWSRTDIPTTQGRYTIVIPAPNTSATTPQGNGYATIVVNRTGVIASLGRTGDNRPFSSSTYLANDETTVPVYGGIRPNGSIYGDVIVNSPASRTLDRDAATGVLHWFLAKDSKRALFPNGVKLDVPIHGSRYTEPAKESPVLSVSSAVYNGNITVSGANLRTPRTERAAITKRPSAGRYDFLFDGAKRLDAMLTVTPRTGAFRGSFYNPTTRRDHRINGVFIQGENKAFGLWNTETKTGKVELTADSNPD